MSTRAPRKFGDADLHDAPPPPADLAEDEAEVWHDVVPQLVSRRVFSRLDTEAAARYCRAVALERRAVAEWTAAGRPTTAEGSTGQLVGHPLVKLIRDARADAARLGTALLLDPASRARAGDTTPAAVGSLAEDMRRRIGKSPRSKGPEDMIAVHGEVYSWDGGLLHADGTPYRFEVPPKLTYVADADTVARFEELHPDGPPARV